MATSHWHSRQSVCEHLQISEATLLRYERAGLVRPRQHEGHPCFGPKEVRRIWSIVSLQQDLGVNLAGVRAILRLRRQMLRARREAHELLTMLEEALSQAGIQAQDQP